MEELRIAFLHLAPAAGDLARNQQLVERSIVLAADAGAKWILTPELVTTGYTFADFIGTDWIMGQPDAWMSRVCKLAHRHKVATFLPMSNATRRTTRSTTACSPSPRQARSSGSTARSTRCGSARKPGRRPAWRPRSSTCSPAGCRPTHLCRCLFAHERSGDAGEGRQAARVGRSVGSRAAWPEWRMGAGDRADRLAAFRLQSHGPG